MTKKINIIIIVVLAILLVMEVILVKNNSFIPIDNYIYNNISKFINPFNTAIFKFFSFFGSEIFIIGLFILILVKEKSRGIGFIFILGMSLLLNQGLKLVIGRDRPNINQIVNETSYSFPSGHTMIATTIVGVLIYNIWHNSKNKLSKKVFLSTILIVFALMIMLSRIYLGVHYFSDILGGITTALLLLAIVHYYYAFKYKVPYFIKTKENRG